MTKRRTLTIVLLAAGVLLTGCTNPLSPDRVRSGASIDNGKRIFEQSSCKLCHTLSADNAYGVVGPSLDELQPTEQMVLRAVRTGPGGMPPRLAAGNDAQDVALYIASMSGEPPAGG